MIGLLQRVSSASVLVEGEIAASIGQGLLVFVGIESADTKQVADRLLQRLLNYRVFEDGSGRMNRCLRDLGTDSGGLLLVPQFTLVADTNSGNRPSFTPAAPPDVALDIYQHLVGCALSIWPLTGSGKFGAEMEVKLTNAGPATFLLRV